MIKLFRFRHTASHEGTTPSRVPAPDPRDETIRALNEALERAVAEFGGLDLAA